MTPDKPRYEVWQEDIHGVWSLAHEEDGTQHFDDLKRAERLFYSLVDEGMLRKTSLIKVAPMVTMNCAGAGVAGRMGLLRNGVTIQGSFKVRSGPAGTDMRRLKR